jgi:hypothetical protein
MFTLFNRDINRRKKSKMNEISHNKILEKFVEITSFLTFNF